MCNNRKLNIFVYVFADSLVWWITDIPNPWKPPVSKCECVEQVWEWHEAGRQRGSWCVAGSHQHTIIIHCFRVLCNETWAPHQELLSPASRASHGDEVSYVTISSFVDHVEILKCMLQFLFMHIRTVYTAVKIISMNCIARWRNASCVVLTGDLNRLFCVIHKKRESKLFCHLWQRIF